MSAKPPDARCRAHLDTWRALAALPAMTASLLLLVFLLGGVGLWEGPVLLSWLAAGVLTLRTRRSPSGVSVPAPVDRRARAYRSDTNRRA